MGAGANWRGRGPGRIEAAADRGAYLRGIDARHLRSGDPRRRRLGRRRRAPTTPRAAPGAPGIGGGLSTPASRSRVVAFAGGRGRARYRLGLWANASSVRKASSAASLLWEGGVETNEDGDAEQWVYTSPAGGEVSFIRPFYRPTIFRIAPVVPAVFANWSVLPGMLVYANPS